MKPRPPSPPAVQLRERESALADMVRQIDEKLLRLKDARAGRAAALTNIRSELARAILGGSGGPAQHERR